jgi:hypothetical protein
VIYLYQKIKFFFAAQIYITELCSPYGDLGLRS